MKIKYLFTLVVAVWLVVSFVPASTHAHAHSNCKLKTLKLISNDQVYVCDNGKVGKYHYSNNCRGLNACKHDIVKKSLSTAKSEGYELCGWED